VPGGPSGLGWLPDGRLLVVSIADLCVYRREADGMLVRHADLSKLHRFQNGQSEALVDRREQNRAGAADKAGEEMAGKMLQPADALCHATAVQCLGLVLGYEQAQLFLCLPAASARQHERGGNACCKIGLQKPTDILLRLDRAEVEKIAAVRQAEDVFDHRGVVARVAIRHGERRCLVAIGDATWIKVEFGNDVGATAL